MDTPGLKWKTVGGSNPFLFRADTLVPGREVTIDDAKTPTDDNLNKIVQAGAVIGRITASGIYRECTATVLTKAATDAAVDYYVDNAKALVVGDLFTASADAGSTFATAKAITAIEYDTADGDKVTVASTLGVALAVGDQAKTSDGGGTPIGVSINSVDVTKGDGVVTLAKRADLNEVGMPYAVTGKNKTLPAAVVTALLALKDCTLTVEAA